MDKDKVIEMAKRAGLDANIPDGYCREEYYTGTAEELQSLIQLARDDYRAELLAGSGEPVGYKRDEGTLGSSADAMHDMAKAGACWDGYEYVYTSDQLAAAVLRERERTYRECSILAEQCEDQNHAARMIRARGQK